MVVVALAAGPWRTGKWFSTSDHGPDDAELRTRERVTMALKLTLNRADRVRTAPCHRCGWTSDLHRVERQDRRYRSVATYRWLCAECTAELDHPAGSGQVPEPPAVTAARLRHPVGARS
jgi:hypothetical protein